MQHLEVSGVVRYIYIYVIRRLKVKVVEKTFSFATYCEATVRVFVRNVAFSVVL